MKTLNYLFLVLAIFILSFKTAKATELPRGNPSSCESALYHAEMKYRIVPGLLRAMSIVESGMNPYSINGDGQSYHPKTLSEAIALVHHLQKKGVHFIDVGCMQIDLYYHPQAFASLEEAFNPDYNVDYAAYYLADTYARQRNWMSAVAFYHAKTPYRQKAYIQSVIKNFKKDSVTNSTALITEKRRLAPLSIKLSYMTIARNSYDSEEN
jgi:hypothetical protein